jgi:branched-chain amino acid transport system permease protein
VIAVALAMLAALLVGLPLLRLRGHYLALATLGLGSSSRWWPSRPRSWGPPSGIFGSAQA